MSLKQNVTEKQFEREFLINNADGSNCIASVKASWIEYHHSVPATFDHADESETITDDLELEFYTNIQKEGVNVEITLKNQEIPYDIFWNIIAHLDKYGKEFEIPDMIMVDVKEDWDVGSFAKVFCNSPLAESAADLLEALEAVIKAYDNYGKTPSQLFAIKNAREALKKAKGE